MAQEVMQEAQPYLVLTCITVIIQDLRDMMWMGTLKPENLPEWATKNYNSLAEISEQEKNSKERER